MISILAPDNIDAITGTMKRVYTETRGADSLVSAVGGWRLYEIGDKATWIAQLRTRISMLNDDAGIWLDCKPSAVALAYSPFSSYRSTFHAVSAAMLSGGSKDTVLKCMDKLRLAAEKCLKDSRISSDQFGDWVSLTETHMYGMDDSIKEAWRALGSAEKKTVELAERIVAVQDEIHSLDGVIAPDNLSSKTISSLSGVITNTASMFYSVVIAGLPVPYMTAVGTFFTLGSLFYNIFANASGIHNKLKQLEEYKSQLDVVSRSLAQTKAALVLLYKIKELIAAQHSSFEELEVFWQNELRNINTVRDRFAALPVISPDDLEIRQLPIAEAVWDALEERSQSLLMSFAKGADGRTKISITT